MQILSQDQFNVSANKDQIFNSYSLYQQLLNTDNEPN